MGQRSGGLVARGTTLPDASARLTAIIQSSQDAIFATDLAGAVTAWGPGAERLFGYAEDEILGRSVVDLMPSDRADELCGLLERLRAGAPVDNLPMVRLGRDGDRIHVSVTLAPITDQAGGVLGVSVIARDVTASIVAERQHRRTQGVDKKQEILEQIARGDDLGQVLEQLCLEVEARYPGGRCSC